MNIRVLPPNEYSRLPFETGPLALYVVAEDEAGEIKAVWGAQPMVHLEPFWTSEDVRGKGGIYLKAMAPTMYALLNQMDEKFFICTAPLDLDNEGSDVVQSEGTITLDYLTRLGLKPWGISMVGVIPSPTEENT